MPYLYFDMGAAVLCASFMSFGVKRRWFALGAALQLAVSTYAAYLGGYVHYGDWLKVSASAPEWGGGHCGVQPGRRDPQTEMEGPQRPHQPLLPSVERGADFAKATPPLADRWGPESFKPWR